MYENEIAEDIAEDLGYDISMEEISDLYKKFLSSVKHVKDNGSTENKFEETIMFDGWMVGFLVTRVSQSYEFEIIVKFYED